MARTVQAGGGKRQEGFLLRRAFLRSNLLFFHLLLLPCLHFQGAGRGVKPPLPCRGALAFAAPSLHDLEHVTSLLWAQFPPEQWEAGPRCLRGFSCPSSRSDQAEKMPQEHGVSGVWVLARAALGTCPEREEEAEREAEEPGLEAASPGEFSWRELPGPSGWLVGGVPLRLFLSRLGPCVSSLFLASGWSCR